ncbi:putative integral inner membrane protein [[Clostridium] ultunense Esp]|nr:putative integral inner membrane protein [[Clostridium] ultunense Esp]
MIFRIKTDKKAEEREKLPRGMETIINGLKSGLRTTWVLGKVVFPITFLMTLLSHTPVLGWIISFFKPIMGWIGLPGEAAIPLVLGNALNLYAGIGAMLSLPLTVKSVFILAMMLSFSHSLPIETTLAKKVGVNPWLMLGTRLTLAFASALFLSSFWHGGNEMARYGLVEATQTTAAGFLPVLWLGMVKAFLGVFQIALIVFPLMVGIQALKDWSVLPRLTRFMAPVTGLLGVARHSAVMLLAGLLFGLAYGAGVMIEAVKEEPLSKRDLHLLLLFLVACHSVVEDTLIFVPLGIPVWGLLLIRVIVAFIVTILAARIVDRLWRNKIGKGEAYEV